MADLRALLDYRSVNALVAWAATGILFIAAVMLLVQANVFWSAFALLLVGLVLLPPVVSRDPMGTMPGELVVLVAIPVTFRLLGVFLELTQYVAIAGSALLVVLVLDWYTSLEMAPRFAVAFVTITTMAFAGAWAVAEFATDIFLGTDFISTQRELNLDLVTATAVGLIAGALSEAYFRKTDGAAPLQGPPFSPSFSSRDPSNPDEFNGSAGTTDRPNGGYPTPGTPTQDGIAVGSEEQAGDQVDADSDSSADAATADSKPEDAMEQSPKHRLVLRTLQVILVSIVGYSVVTVQGDLFLNSAVPLGLTFLPTIARRRYDYPMHAKLALLISFAATMHALGALGPYSSTDWYDTFTHALSSTLVAGVGYALAHGLELHTDRVSFSSRFRGVFIILFVLAVGVLWELMEFGTGLFAGAVGDEILAQYGVSDIVKDLVFNTVGAMVVALWGTPLFRRLARGIGGNVGGLLR